MPSFRRKREPGGLIFTVIPAQAGTRWFDNCRHSGASRNLATLLDSGFRRSDGLPAKPPKTKRYRLCFQLPPTPHSGAAAQMTAVCHIHQTALTVCLFSSNDDRQRGQPPHGHQRKIKQDKRPRNAPDPFPPITVACETCGVRRLYSVKLALCRYGAQRPPRRRQGLSIFATNRHPRTPTVIPPAATATAVMLASFPHPNRHSGVIPAPQPSFRRQPESGNRSGQALLKAPGNGKTHRLPENRKTPAESPAAVDPVWQLC